MKDRIRVFCQPLYSSQHFLIFRRNSTNPRDSWHPAAHHAVCVAWDEPAVQSDWTERVRGDFRCSRLGNRLSTTLRRTAHASSKRGASQNFVGPTQDRTKRRLIRHIIVESKAGKRATIPQSVAERGKEGLGVSLLKYLCDESWLLCVDDVGPLGQNTLANNPWVASRGHTFELTQLEAAWKRDLCPSPFGVHRGMQS